ncbi:hypothetical protein HN011_005181 [Eciton burchellii]|nr:hypothetical protein HN011_005181 [Eciton burchellii]
MDLAFGKCISRYADLDSDNLYRYNLDADELKLLRLQLERLEADGYKWKHPFTQCIMQILLHNLRYGQSDPRDLRLCDYLKKSRSDEQDGLASEVVPAVTILKISPDDENSESNLVNVDDKLPAFYGKDEPLPYDRELGSEYMDWRNDAQKNDQTSISDERYEDEYGTLLNDMRFYPPRMRRYIFINGYNKDDTTDTSEDEESYEDNDNENLYNEPLSHSNKLEFLNKHMQSFSDYPLMKSSDDDDDEKDDEEYEKAFSRKYKHWRKLSRLFDADSARRDSLIRHDEDLDYENDDVDQENSMEIEKLNTEAPSEMSAIYTEGGVVRPSKHETMPGATGTSYDAMLDDDLNTLLWRRELAGFKRRERLDVKKPGPLFSTNNYAFKTQSPPAPLEKDYSEADSQDNNEIYAPLTKKELHSYVDKPLDNLSEAYKNVDLDYVYIEFEQAFHKWLEGEHVIAKVEELLELPSGTLRDIRVGRAEVTFKVVPNDKNYNAIDIAKSIDNIRGKLQDALGLKVIRAGIGDKAKLPATLEVTKVNQINSSLFGALVAAGVAAAIAAAVVTLVIARRHAKSRAKLAGLTTPDPEASKDYQDLCRARMQAKQPNDKMESPRITNLSRENEFNNLPSNRSSTSSWGEEPTLSNMDISTGHMVLSYMEDHLKNKDRLDQEWAALCAYETDPSSTEIAESKANMKQNRPGAGLPYDHSRVVLNDLVNANNSDYINASTITDHDPRNPAYITTQGPLPQTTADFWQLVWEQGSVVIVMLTRLTEEGRAMCHRYWPEEGSELYHIYEVHLVSEHFWCDDYLVRSFYLKNLHTCETRTVTQFHFLSWPENNVPYSTKALLEFRRKVNKSYRGRSCPIVVHCSDGAGRTGTYCLIDMVLNRMTKGAKEIDIAATLEHIRDQKPDMVATKQQFEFVLMAVAEEVHAILKALPAPSTEKSVATTTGSFSPAGKSEQ